MKRTLILYIREPGKRAISYLRQLCDACQAARLPMLVVDPGHSASSLPARFTSSLADAVAMCAGQDEIILTEDRLMGPVLPLNNMLKKADGIKADAWYLARGGLMVALRKKALATPALYTLWETTGDTSAVLAGIAERGLSAKELYDTSDMADLTEQPMLDEPLRMVKELGCPFFRYEVFTRNYDEVLLRTLGHQAQVFYRYLHEESSWDTGLLWDYLLPTYHQMQIHRNMHLTYVLPTKGSDRTGISEHLKQHQLALVMHLYYEDKLPESCSFAARFPEETHVFITTNSEEKRQAILKQFSSLKVAELDVRVIANRGRDVSSLLVGAADVYHRFEYVCFFHDKKTLQTKPGSVGAGFAYKCYENMFATRDFVCNVIRTFRDNPRLGILSPTPPHHADYFFTLGTAWGPNYPLTEALCRRLGYTAPIAADQAPIAPLGTCFWFRTAALYPLTDIHWTYEDFPPEPNNADGTILHAIERIYPYASVEAGYYPGYLLSDRYAQIEYSSMRYYVRDFNTVCFKHGIMSYHRNMRDEVRNHLK